MIFILVLGVCLGHSALETKVKAELTGNPEADDGLGQPGKVRQSEIS